MTPKIIDTTWNKTVQNLFRINKDHSAQFINSQRSRQIYRVKHPTEIAAMKCMDGRVHLPSYTKTPLGIIQPWRTIGGYFDLGMPHYKETIEEWTEYSGSKSRSSIVLTTYHFARGFEGEDKDKIMHRGCAGFKYDTENAKQSSLNLKQQFDRIYCNDGLYAIQCGVETDLEALILHGENGEILDLATVNYSSEDELMSVLIRMYPQIPTEVLIDFIPLVLGNINHIEEVHQSNKAAIDMEHRERVIAVGRGFDWLHTPNYALIIGPYSPDYKDGIDKAAGLISSNVREKRIDIDDGLALLISTPYRCEGYKKRLAEEKARFLTREALGVIQNNHPDLLPHLNVVTSTCDMNTRELHLLS